MFCPSCGSNLEDDARFCVHCGFSIANEQQDSQIVQGEPKNPFKKSKSLKKIIAVIIAITLVIAAFSLAGNVISGMSGSSEAIAYIKNDKLYFKKNMKSKKEAFEVAKLRSEDSSEWYAYYGWCKFSEDGKYLYFFSKVEDGFGKLNRIEVKKIKSDSDKNEKYIKEIASNVYVNDIQLVDKKGVLYKTKSGKLEYFNGKEEETIVKDCYGFSYKEEENILVYAVSKDEGYSLYAGELSLDMDAEEIDEKIGNIASIENPEFLVYTKNGDELYVAGMKGEPKRIAKQYGSIAGIDAEKKSLIFTESVNKESTLYDFVEDDYKDADKGLAEPSKKDYLKDAELMDVVGEYYYQSYTENPESLADFYARLSTDESVGMKIYYTYGKTYYYDGAKWYVLDKESYNEAKDRMELREDLKDSQYSQNLQNAYYYTSEKDVELLIEDVSNIQVGDVESKLLTYQRTSYEKIALSEVEYVGDVRSYLSNTAKRTAYVKVGTGEETELGEKYLSSVSVSEDKSKCAIAWYGDDYEYELLMCDIKKNEVKVGDALVDGESTATGQWSGNTFYYLTDTDDTAVLNRYEKGKSQELLEDIEYGIMIYKDEMYIVSDGDGEYELYGKNNKRLETFDDVSRMLYLNKKCILVIEDGELCLYDGSDDLQEIDNDVDYVTVPTWELPECSLYNEQY